MAPKRLCLDIPPEHLRAHRYTHVHLTLLGNERVRITGDYVAYRLQALLHTRTDPNMYIHARVTAYQRKRMWLPARYAYYIMFPFTGALHYARLWFFISQMLCAISFSRTQALMRTCDDISCVHTRSRERAHAA